MNRPTSALLLLLPVLMWGQEKGARTFQVDLPSDWKAAKALVLVLSGLELPANRGVVLRLFAGGDGSHETLGSVAVLAKSPTAKGAQQVPKLEMNLGENFRRWAETQTGNRLPVMVKPYAGLREAPEIAWQVKEVRLEAR